MAVRGWAITWKVQKELEWNLVYIYLYRWQWEKGQCTRISLNLKTL